MRFSNLIRRNLSHYWRTNLAVLLGVAVTVAVLTGALLVGDSVRVSLRDLVLLRLGATTHVITNENFFRADLARDLQASDSFKDPFTSAAPIIVLEGSLEHEKSGRLASAVQVYGVDERFWQFQGITRASDLAPTNRDALLSPALAREFAAAPGDALLLRVQRPSDIPVESLHGRKDQLGRTIRLTTKATLPPEQLGEFSLRPQQAEVRAVFVPLNRLQRDLAQEGQVNTLLVTENAQPRQDRAANHSADRELESALKQAASLDDAGLRIAIIPRVEATVSRSVNSFSADVIAFETSRIERPATVSLESRHILIPGAAADTAAKVAASLGWQDERLFSYLANTIRVGNREIPYSLVTAANDAFFEPFTASRQRDGGDAARKRGFGVRRLDAALFTQSANTPITPAFFQNKAGASSRTPQGAHPPIWLNDWAARDLAAKPGDTVTLEYFVWQEGGGLRTESAQFELRGTIPIAPLAADQNLAPAFPGIGNTESVSDWDPSFPVDLSRIRPRDEDYWDKYRTTPKALLRLEDGQRLWRSRYGQLTAMRFLPPPGTDLAAAAQDFRARLREALDPSQVGFVIVAARVQGLDASRGAVNFGEYFVYFSFFIVVSAALLAGLFFRLGVEQRLREIGLLRAVGFPERRIARLFLAEGAALAVLGSALGLAGAIAYGALLVYGLRTWWVGSVGTTLLRLHISTLTLVAGAAGGVLIALVVIALTLRGLRKATPVNLLAGARQFTGTGDAAPRRTSRALTLGILCAILGLALLAAAAAGYIAQAGGFFGAGFLLLTALLFFNWAWLAGKRKYRLAGAGAAGKQVKSKKAKGKRRTFREDFPFALLNARGKRRTLREDFPFSFFLVPFALVNARWRPGRSLLCIALIASATFLIVAVDSFRRGDIDPLDPRSGAGGYPLLAESLLPIPYDLATPQGRDAAGLDASQLQAAAPSGELQFVSFRLRPGDDASCLNLYQPQNPRILGASPQFISAARFSFQSSLAGTPDEERNPWQLLDARFDDGAIPAIADANSLTYVLHRKLGEDFVFDHVRDPRTNQPLRLRMVAALSDSIFQSEIIISEDNFQRLFAREPSAAGYRVFLIQPHIAAGSGRESTRATQRRRQSSLDFGSTVTTLEDALSDYGFDVVATADRLAAFHRVENTYLSTFQALGGLGLLLGTFGLAAVLLRNVLERRRELALLRAVGYRRRDLVLLIAAENTLLLALGLASGVLTALLAIAPALAERGTLPGVSFALLIGVLFAGLIASIVAVAAAVRAPLLSILRSE